MTVGPVQIEGLDVDFRIQKTLEDKPDTANLTVFNMTESQMRDVVALNTYTPRRSEDKEKRGKVRAGNIQVLIEGGYQDNRGGLFVGSSDYAVIVLETPDAKLEVAASDAGRNYISSRVSQAFPQGASHHQVARACIQSMGLGEGNLRVYAPELSSTVYHLGTALDGQPAKLLAGVLRRHKLRYTIQNSSVRIMPAGDSPKDRVAGLLIGPDSGLEGQPEINDEGDVICKTAMLPSLSPGDYVRLQSHLLSGDYFIRSMITTGSSAGGTWGHQLTLTAVV